MKYTHLSRLVCVVVALDLMALNSQTPADETKSETAKPADLRILKTPKGNPFGVFAEKPARPAPTLMIFATAIEAYATDPTQHYTATGRDLVKDGWIYVVLDPPCHGFDQREGEPQALSGWAHRIKNGVDLMGPFTQRCKDVLDYLIAEGYSDPTRIVAEGTSRGGFCALHFAAAEPRVRAVAAVSPVTNPLALSEFKGVTPEQVAPIGIEFLAERLVGRSVWMSMGNDDQRVDTDACVQLARKLVANTRKSKPELSVVPVELLIGPSPGHRAVDDAYLLAAGFLRKWNR